MVEVNIGQAILIALLVLTMVLRFLMDFKKEEDKNK
jgi:hypothetical protein